MRMVALVVCVWLSGVAAGAARDVYVNNSTGNDHKDGRSPVPSGDEPGPVRTIARALQLAEKGDRVILAKTGKPYRESITLQGGRHSGLSSLPFELLGNGATLDGTRTIAVTSWKFVDDQIFRCRLTHATYPLLYVDGKPAERRKVTNSDQIKDLEPLQWCLLGPYLYFRGEPDRLPQSYDLAISSMQTGITLYEVRNVEISDLVIQGFRLDGVNAHDGVFQTRLVGLTCRGNGRSGISVGGASRVTVESCLVGNNGRAQLRSEGFSHTRIVGCDLLDNTAPKIVRDGGEVSVDR